MEQDFHKDLDELISMLKKNEKYAFVRFGDGEGRILLGKRARRRRDSATWIHSNGNYEDEKFKLALMKSIRFSDKNYFVGLRRKCCSSKFHHWIGDKIIKMTTVPKEQLTFACIFQSTNWHESLNRFMPETTNKESYLICNEYGRLEDKSSFFNKTFLVPKVDAHLEWEDTYLKIKKYIETNKVTNAVFLFATGPGSAPIIHNLWKINKENFFIDIGSILDRHLFKHAKNRGRSRGFIRRDTKGYKECKW
jgi:hypothetical protein|tara:strand:- start:2465 stop:3214 length:750 start_codon:yes stop_codon:yes gene_type:complete